MNATGTPFDEYMKTSRLVQMSSEELDQLESTIMAVVDTDNSTMSGLNGEKSLYETLIANSVSTITALEDQKHFVDIQLSGYIQDRNDLYTQSTLVNDEIIGTIQAIQYQSTILYESISSLFGLSNENQYYRQYLADSEASFIQSTLYYSSLVQQYMEAEYLYEQTFNRMSSIRHTYESTLAASEGLSNAYATSAAQLAASEAALKDYEETYATTLSDLATAYKLRGEYAEQHQSTVAGITVLSSLYESAVATLQLAEYVKQQKDATDAYNDALEVAGLANAEYEKNANAANLAAAQIGNSQIQELRKKKETIDDLVQQYSAQVDQQIGVNYEAEVKVIDEQIKIQLENISTFKSQKVLAYKSRDAQSSLMEAALQDVRDAIGLSTLYTEQYTSTLVAVGILEGFRDDKIRSAVQDEATLFALSPIISSLQLEVDDYRSTLTYWTNMSTFHAEQLDIATSSFIAYAAEYESTNTGIIAMDVERAQLDKTIKEMERNIKYYSSIERKESIRSNYYENAAMKDYNTIEFGCQKYRETFIREKKMQVQTEYEGLVFEEVQRVSTLIGTNPAAPASERAVNYERADIKEKEGAFQKLTDSLGEFITLEDVVNTQNTNIGELVDILQKKLDIQIQMDAQALAAEAEPMNQQLQEAYLSSITGMSNLDTTIAAKKTVIETGKGVLDTQRATILTTYSNIFTPAEVSKQEDTISSILIEASKVTAAATAATAI